MDLERFSPFLSLDFVAGPRKKATPLKRFYWKRDKVTYKTWNHYISFHNYEKVQSINTQTCVAMLYRST